MASVAMNPALRRTFGFWDTTLGKKAVMAVTGVILVLFVLGHMAGNLQIYYGVNDPALGVKKLNEYAHLLRFEEAILWLVRLVLLGSVVLHVVAAIQLALLQKKARPQGYVVKKPTKSTYASRTMYWSGPILFAFIVYHIMHLTLGVGGTSYEHMNPYNNVIAGFQNPIVSVFYIISMILLCTHLYHGVWSMFQTLGINRKTWDKPLKNLARAYAIIVALGNISIPVAVLAGVVKMGPTLASLGLH